MPGAADKNPNRTDKLSGPQKNPRKAYIQSIHTLIDFAETKDPYTKRHSVKVRNYAVLLAKRVGLGKKDIETIRMAAILHDIGKISVRQKVLLKNGPLTKNEYEEVKKHSEIGAEIITQLKFSDEVISIIKHHHENYDGTGYPEGLKREKIPVGARILAITDVYDALVSKRAYRNAYPHKKAIEIMKQESGKKFDPALLDAFIDCLSSGEKVPAAKGDK